MRLVKGTGWVVAAVLAAVGCAPVPAPGISSGSTTPASGTRQVGGTIVLSLQPARPMSTKVAPKVTTDVASYTANLYRASDDALMLGPNSAVVTPGAGTATIVFAGVPVGDTYYLKVDAFDAGSQSIVKNSPIRSNNVTVSGTGTFNVAMALPLLDGTGGSVPVTMAPPSFLTGTINCRLWLKNQATSAVITPGEVIAAASPAVTSKTVIGVPNGTYTIYAAIHDATVSTTVTQCGTVTITNDVTTDLRDASGSVVAAISPTFAASTTTFGTLADATNSKILGLAVDSTGRAYALDGNTQSVWRVDSAGAGPVQVVGNGSSGNANDGDAATGSVIDVDPFTPVGLAVDVDGNIFIGDTNNAKLRMVPAAGIPSGRYGVASMSANQIYTVRSGLGFLYPRGVAVDASRNLYYSVNTSGVKHVVRVDPNNNETDLGAPGGIPNGLAVDRLGNVYCIGTNTDFLSMYVVSPGTYFGTAMSAGWNSVPGYTGFTTRGVAVDTLGNLYVVNNVTSSVQVINTSGAMYRVVGTGSTTPPIFSGGSPVSGTLAGLSSSKTVALDPNGNLFFDLNNNVWRLP